MALSARVPHTPLRRLLALLAFTVVVDLVIASAVLVDRLDDPDIPDFNRAAAADIRWDVDPYRDPSPLLGFPARLTRPTHSATPEARTLFVIAALERYDRTQDRRWVSRARRELDHVLDDTDAGLVRHSKAATDLLGRPVEAPWYAADAQGMLLSALARMYEVTGRQRLRTGADQAFAALRSFQGFFAGSQPAPEHWLGSLDSSGYLWFDQFSTRLSSTSVLTEQLWTALGIYDYGRVLADVPVERRLARQMFAGSLATVEHYLPQWRVPGRISVSSLVAGNRDVRSHFVATRQLAIVAEIAGGGWAGRAARLYGLDDNLPYFALAPVAAAPDLDVYSPVPAAIATLARTGRPLRRTPSHEQPAAADRDLLRRLAEALVLLAGPPDDPTIRRAESLVEQVVAGVERGAVPHRSAVEDTSGERVRGPWYSSSTQGLLLSALTRLHERTGHERWRRDADTAFAALTRVRDYGAPSDWPWLGLVDFSGYLWFDQNLGASPLPRSVYEHVAALVGLYDYWRLTGRDDAFVYLAGGVTTLRAALPLVRRTGKPAVESLAVGAGDPAYHDLITSEIEALAAITEDRRLTRFARLLRTDYP